MSRELGFVVALAFALGAGTAAAQDVKHVANQVGHATAHAAKETAKTTRHVANQAGHATAHAAKETAGAARHVGNQAGHAVAHAAKETADAVTPPDQAELAREARVSPAGARAAVLNHFHGAMIEESHLERKSGDVVYEYHFRQPGVEGKQKVWVDARTGDLLIPRHQ